MQYVCAYTDKSSHTFVSILYIFIHQCHWDWGEFLSLWFDHKSYGQTINLMVKQTPTGPNGYVMCLKGTPEDLCMIQSF